MIALVDVILPKDLLRITSIIDMKNGYFWIL